MFIKLRKIQSNSNYKPIHCICNVYFVLNFLFAFVFFTFTFARNETVNNVET